MQDDPPVYISNQIRDCDITRWKLVYVSNQSGYTLSLNYAILTIISKYLPQESSHTSLDMRGAQPWPSVEDCLSALSLGNTNSTTNSIFCRQDRKCGVINTTILKKLC